MEECPRLRLRFAFCALRRFATDDADEVIDHGFDGVGGFPVEVALGGGDAELPVAGDAADRGELWVWLEGELGVRETLLDDLDQALRGRQAGADVVDALGCVRNGRQG